MHSRRFQEAYKCSVSSDFYKCKTGCVAYYNGVVLARGWNSHKTHPLQNKYNKLRFSDTDKFRCCLHAEMMVVAKIRHLDIDFAKVQIYVWRGEKDRPRLSKPCAACEQALKDLGIKDVYYTGELSFIHEVYI